MYRQDPTRQIVFQANDDEKEKKNFNEKQFVKAQKHTKLAADRSGLKTFSEEVKKEFMEFANKMDANASKNSSNAFNRMYIYTKNNTDSPVEAINTKDKHMYYRVSATMLKEILENVNESVFPVKVDKVIIDKKGQEVSEKFDYTKDELTALMQEYDKKARYYETRSSQSNNSRANSKDSQNQNTQEAIQERENA